MGSFSKTFASNGWFLTTHSESVKQVVKYFGGPNILFKLTVSRAARFRMQVMAEHTPEQARRAAKVVGEAIKAAQQQFASKQ